MYEAKYSKYLIKNTNRFCTKEEIMATCSANAGDSPKSYSGAPLLYSDGVMYVDSSDKHYLISGETGCKKSRTQTVNTILSIVLANECGVINDPKGELYRKTAGFAKEHGYNVKVFNMRNPRRSNGWNMFTLPHRLNAAGESFRSDDMISDIIYSLVQPAKEHTVDNFWSDKSESYIYGVCRLLLDSVTEEYFNIAGITEMCQKHNGKTLNELLKKTDLSVPFLSVLHGTLNLRAEKTSDCIYETINQILSPLFKNQALFNMLCHNDIDFQELVTKKTLYYIIYPDEKDTMAFIANLFLSQCYLFLIYHLETSGLERLSTRVNFVLDEFGNLPKVNNFQNRISEARGYNIRYFLYCQSYGQLENIYGKFSETIKGNCDWIVFPSKETSFLREVSELCGKITDHNGFVRPLLPVDKILHLKKYQNGAQAVVVRSGSYPFITKSPDYEYVDIYKHCRQAVMPEYDHSKSICRLSMKVWLTGIQAGSFKFPFCEDPSEKRAS